MQREYQKGAVPVILLFIVLLLIFGVFAEPWIVDFINRGEGNSPVSSDKTQTDLVRATGTYSAGGHSVVISMEFPKNGGSVTGTISGDCTGILSGRYAGEESGIIDATGRGSCSLGFLKIPGTGSFTGTVSQTGRTVDVALYGKALGYGHSGTMTLAFE